MRVRSVRRPVPLPRALIHRQKRDFARAGTISEELWPTVGAAWDVYAEEWRSRADG